MVTLWRWEESGTVQSDPGCYKTDPNLLDAVYDLIKENHAISRAELARRLETSERQVRKVMNCATRRLGARAVIPESGKLLDKIH